jgi:hypothetical protein
MKKITAVLTALALLNFPHANAAYNPTKPSVTQCSASTTTLPDSGGSLQITMHVVDPTPVNLVIVNVMNTAGDSVAFGRLTLSSGTETDGDWSSSFVVKADLKPDAYSVWAQNVMDTSNNGITFYTCPGLKINYGTSTVVAAPPAPAATPKATASAAPIQNTNSDLTAQIADLKAQLENSRMSDQKLVSTITELQKQLKESMSLLTATNLKLKKICSQKIKPKGC